MAQSDQVVQNATFPTVRGDINDNLAALYSQSSGPSAPTTTVAFQPWVDTSSSPPLWKIRNASNTGWITVGTLDPAEFQVEGNVDSLLPSQTGNAGKALLTDGAALLWGTIAASTFTKYLTPGTFTWNKPSGGTTAIVICWGGGGSGGRGGLGAGGGAGASGVIGILKLSDLSATETITVGAGGASVSVNGNGNSGGNSSFGTHVIGYGGIYGTNAAGSYSFGSTAWAQGTVETSAGFAGFDALTIFNGGSSRESRTDSDGGNGIFGGGAGGSCDASGTVGGNGGASVFGGDGGYGTGGGTAAGAGQQPGGGGGASESADSGAGGDGAVWVITL